MLLEPGGIALVPRQTKKSGLVRLMHSLGCSGVDWLPVSSRAIDHRPSRGCIRGIRWVPHSYVVLLGSQYGLHHPTMVTDNALLRGALVGSLTLSSPDILWEEMTSMVVPITKVDAQAAVSDGGGRGLSGLDDLSTPLSSSRSRVELGQCHVADSSLGRSRARRRWRAPDVSQPGFKLILGGWARHDRRARSSPSRGNTSGQITRSSSTSGQNTSRGMITLEMDLAGKLFDQHESAAAGDVGGGRHSPGSQRR